MRTVMVAVALFACGANYPAHRRFMQPTLPATEASGSGGGGGFVNPSTVPDFEFANTAGSGMGAACACTTPTGLTFTRASSAECISTDGQTFTTCTTNQPRVMTGSVDDTVLGVMIEQTARTNLVTYSSDLSQADWVKSNMTCTLTATGLHGANTASHCCATASDATALTDVLTADGSYKTASMYLKRSVGSGSVTLTPGDATYLSNISASLSNTLWKRAVPQASIGCQATNGGTSLCIVQAGLWNAADDVKVGFKLATSGDCIDVDMVQTERASPVAPAVVGFASTPIYTNGASATRAAEFGDVAMSPSLPQQYCAAATIVTDNIDFPDQIPLHGVPGDRAPGVATGSTTYDATYNNQSDTGYITALTTTVGPAYSSVMTNVVPIPPRMRVTSYYDGLYLAGCLNGACAVGTLYDGTYVVPTWTRYRLGAYDSSLKFNGGVFKQVQLDSQAVVCNRWLNTAPTQFAAALGDSITCCGDGSNAGWTQPANATWAGARQIQSVAQSGRYAADILSEQWTGKVKDHRYSHIFVLGGINDITQGHDMAAALASLTQIWDEARAAGIRVHLLTLTPAGGYAGWNGTKQTALTTLNTAITDYCTLHGLTCIDTYNSALRNGTSLAVAYDSGDGLHPNEAGEAIIAGLVTTAVP